MASCSEGAANKRQGIEWTFVKNVQREGKRSGQADATCMYCNVSWLNINATRIRAHFIGGMNDVQRCKSAPAAVREALHATVAKKQKTLGSMGFVSRSDAGSFGGSGSSRSGNPLYGLSAGSGSMSSPGASVFSGPQSVTPPGDNLVQQVIDTGLQKALKGKVDEQVSRMFINCGLSFNVARHPDFKKALSMIADYGSNKVSGGRYAAPGYNLLRNALLLKERERVEAALVPFKDTFEVYGVTLVSDGWTDVGSRPLLNVLAVSPFGVMFLEGIDTSGEDKTGLFIANTLSKIIMRLGPDNVVQVVMDGAANCVNAGDRLEREYEHVTFSKCTAHSLDLLLSDVGKEKWVDEIVTAGKTIVLFVTNHHKSNAIFRHLSQKKLAKPCDTRFGTNFLMLSSLLECKGALQQCVYNPAWIDFVNNPKNKVVGEQVRDIVVNEAWWSSVSNLLGLLSDIFALMRLFDGNQPSIGKVYCHMSSCLDKVEKNTNYSQAKLKIVAGIVKKRWNYMHSPLHSLAYVLDPEYKTFDWFVNKEVKTDFMKTLTKMYDLQFARAALIETATYKLFSDPDAIADLKETPGWLWWQLHGADFPNMRQAAMRILGHVSSACACERSWSTYDFIHSRVRNRLIPERARDLVFCFTNNRLLTELHKNKGKFSYVPWQVEENSQEVAEVSELAEGSGS
jgi:Protein of unknown function (DUF 659)/hAT family C-terminal dimerisation region